MRLKYEDFAKHIAGKPLPVYVLAGEEQFLLDEALEKIEASLAVDTMNRETFHLPESAVDDIIVAMQTMPFLSDRRLVIVRDAQKLKAADAEKLSAFISRPSEASCLVLLWSDRVPKEKELKKSALFAAAGRAGAIVEFKPVYERELPSWIQKRCASRGKRIGSEAVMHLIAESGPGLLDYAGEIEKLALYTGKNTEITARDVEEAGGHTRHSDLNAFSDALESRNTALALRTAEGLLRDGEPALRILAVVYRVVRRMIVAKSMLEQKKSSRLDIQQELRLHPYFGRNFFDHCALFRRENLEKGLLKIRTADAELKRSARPDAEIIEELVLALCRK